ERGLNSIAIVFRADAAGQGYQANLGGEKKYAALSSRVDNKLQPLTPLRDNTLEPGRWYRARVEVRGDRMRFLLDGALIAEAQDSRHPRGGVGLRLWRATGRFRALKITAPDGAALFAGVPRLDLAPSHNL